MTRGDRGLSGDEIDGADATVHSTLAADPAAFRRRASDHLPVTADVRVGADSDQ